MKQNIKHQRSSGKLIWIFITAIAIAAIFLLLLFSVNHASQFYQNRAAVQPTLTPLPTRMPTRPSPLLPENWNPPNMHSPETFDDGVLIPLNKPEDAISIVMNDRGFQNTMNEFFFGLPSEKITANNPVFVRALSGAYPDGYYIVSFQFQDKVVGVAAVGLQDGGGQLVVWSKTETGKFPPISRDGLQTYLKAHAIEIIAQPELVYSDWKITPNFRYGGNPNAPFWLVRSIKSVVYYIFYDYVQKKPLIYNPSKDQIIE